MTLARLELRMSFAAAHRAPSPRSGCPGLHGHSFGLRVTLAGEVDQPSGTVADVPRVRALLHELVYQPLDHRLLDDVIENPTLERVASHVLASLAPHLPELVEVALDDGEGRTVVVGR